MSVNRLNFGNLAPAPSASMTRTTHSKKPHVHRCVSGCVNNFGVRSGNQRAVDRIGTGASPWCRLRVTWRAGALGYVSHIHPIYILSNQL